MTRLQCQKCPWRVGVDPEQIPAGYSSEKHARLARTIAERGVLPAGDRLRIMACHETPIGRERPCVGWLVNQLGPGQNIGLRWAVKLGRIDADVRTRGPQHATFQDTLPKG